MARRLTRRQLAALGLPAELAALGVRRLHVDPLRSCPACSTPTAPSRAGERAYCLRCTERELGATSADNSLRIEQGLTWGAYWSKVERYGKPEQNAKPWALGSTRLKRKRHTL